MKDLHLRDIIRRPERLNKKLSVFVNGQWAFAAPGQATRISDNQSYYLVSSPFGIMRANSNNPGSPVLRGEAGDYLAVNRTSGVYEIVTKEQYKLLFPSPNQDFTPAPTNAEALRNPNFITKTVLESTAPESNEVQVGARTFSLDSTIGKQVVVLDTPQGQSKVQLDASSFSESYYATTNAEGETIYIQNISTIPTKPT